MHYSKFLARGAARAPVAGTARGVLLACLCTASALAAPPADAGVPAGTGEVSQVALSRSPRADAVVAPDPAAPQRRVGQDSAVAPAPAEPYSMSDAAGLALMGACSIVLGLVRRRDAKPAPSAGKAALVPGEPGLARLRVASRAGASPPESR